MKFLGAPYPILPHPRGYLHTQNSLDQVKSDLLILLLTNPGERVMLPDFGTPLRNLIFEPNDQTLVAQAKQMIIQSISTWEPRITVQQINISTVVDTSILSPADTLQDLGNILSIQILFFDPESIQNVQELILEVPLGGTY